MISSKMLPLLSNNSAIRQMFEEGRRLKKEFGEENVFDFSLGNPAVAAPFEVDRAIMECITTEDPAILHAYMPNQGYVYVREAIIGHLNALHHTNYHADQLVMTSGAATGLNIVLKSLLDDMDEVIVFTPYFVEYQNYVNNYGGKLVAVDTDDNFMPDLQDFAAKITAKTKAVLINSPNNPTGVIYGEKVLSGLEEVIREKEKEFGTCIATISDEPYRDLAYDNIEVPWVPDWIHNTIVVYSYSKSLSLAGERIGWVLIPGDFTEAERFTQAVVIANRVIGCVNAPALFQRTIAKTIGVETEVEFYDYNRKYIYDLLTKLGFEMPYPQGAFYLFIKTGMDDVEFCRIAKKHHILLVPGSAFGKSGYARLSYSVGHEVIERCDLAFEGLAKELGKSGNQNA